MNFKGVKWGQRIVEDWVIHLLSCKQCEPLLKMTANPQLPCSYELLGVVYKSGQDLYENFPSRNETGLLPFPPSIRKEYKIKIKC